MNQTSAIFLGIIVILCSVVSPSFGAGEVVAPLPRDPYATSKQPPAAGLSCPADPVVTNERCEGGICLTQAPGGVTGNTVTLKGKVGGGAITGLLASVQHDRTRAVATVNAAGVLKPDGQFELVVPLQQFGSYTIVIQGVRVAGPPLLFMARVSRVIAPHDLSPSSVTISESVNGSDHVIVSVDLEKSCRETAKAGLPKDCDLIGSQSGATMIEAVNRVSSGREIVRRTNAGSEGQFHLCMPLGDGDNTIEVRVCSPALDACKMLVTKALAFARPEPRVRWTDSNPQHLRFAVDHWTPKKIPNSRCEGQIDIQWNHDVRWNPVTKKEDPAQALCPVDGEYRIPGAPVVGVNELSISLPGETGREFHYTFGWGRAVWAKEMAANIIAIRIDHAVLDRELPGLINRFLESDEFPKMVQTMLTTAAADHSHSPGDSAKTGAIHAIRGEIPACKAGKTVSTTMRMIGKPSIGKIHLNVVRLEPGSLFLDVTLDDVGAHLQYFKDADLNGEPDEWFFPVKIGFKTLHVRPRLVLKDGASPMLLLTADTDDCLYKGASYCRHRPSPVQPGEFQGSIDAGGAFVMCDNRDQLVPSEIANACTSINNADAKTGQVSEQILEAINETLYCDTSAQLTYALRHLKIPVRQTFPVAGRKLAWNSELALSAGGLSIGADGVAISLGSQVESKGFYYTATPARSPGRAELAADAGGEAHRLSLIVREDLVNQALAALTTLGNPGEGLLDWSLDEAVIGAMGFDFNTRCDPAQVKGELPALCQMRPTVEKLLGSDLSTANYYQKDQPLRITVRGDRVLAPHLRFRVTAANEMVADLDIPNLELGFAALPKDPSQVPMPIITARVTLLISMTIEKIATDSNDPSQLVVRIRLRPGESRVAIMPVTGSNRTLLPDHVLVGQLRSLLNWGLEESGKPEKAPQPISIPKRFFLPAAQLSESDETLFSRMGLTEIRLGEGDLQWTIDPFDHALRITADPQFIQRLTTGGIVREFVWGN